MNFLLTFLSLMTLELTRLSSTKWITKTNRHTKTDMNNLLLSQIKHQNYPKMLDTNDIGGDPNPAPKLSLEQDQHQNYS